MLSRPLFFIVVCALVAGAPLTEAQNASPANANKPTAAPSIPASGSPMVVSPATNTNTNLAVASTTTSPGVTQALKDVKLSMTVAGRIDGMLVREGTRVTKGQLLMHLDRTLEELEVQRRRLQLEDMSKLEELRLKEKTLALQVASLAPLLLSGGVSRKQAEDEEMSLGTVAAERKALEASKERERIELSLAQEAYERRHLRAPFDGVVTKVALRVGESIAAHEPLITLVDTSRVRFMGTVPARTGTKLQVGAMVNIELATYGQSKRRAAKVVFVSPVADPSSGLLEVIAEFDNLDGSVRPGISGRLLL